MRKKNREKEDIDEINPYQVDKFSKIPSGFILTFAKFWAAAAAVFFILIGGVDLGINFSTPAADGYAEMARTIVSVILVALFLAILLNYGVKHLAHLMLNRRNNTKKWMILNLKGFLAFLAYMVYSIICVTALFFIVSFFSMKGWVPSFLENNGCGVEPFSFGLLFIVVDGLFLALKNGCINLYQRVKYRREILAE